ncbi:hypothetical protein CDL12_22333 [Handroanthus impetiginosus]|uniref:Uncharacterized protein n=1 Tax=Handroanthus impetiginosus TaxID=429701 RepID=A0A2G9GIV1_9LAMI|nr:hypothetical protein CDL12_22333 [Handroanthus impetiginosus]
MVAEADDVVSAKLLTTSAPPATATATANANAKVTSDGLIITITDAIRSFLTAASKDSHLSRYLNDLSSSLIMQSTIPYKSLKTIWFGSNHDTRPDLSSLLSGSDFIFTSPKPREKSEELKLRLKKLEEAAERNVYQELVKDITPKKGVEEEEPFSSYKDQLGFGKHLVFFVFFLQHCQGIMFILNFMLCQMHVILDLLTILLVWGLREGIGILCYLVCMRHNHISL